MDPDRINAIADSLLASSGEDGAGASTGERIAAALVAGHPEWGNYTLPCGAVNVLAMLQRLGPDGIALVQRLWDERH